MKMTKIAMHRIVGETCEQTANRIRRNNMTNEQAQAYLKNNGLACPICGQDAVQGGNITIDNGTAHQECSCDECCAEWTDSYHLAAHLAAVIDDEGNIFDKEVPDATM